VCLSCFSRRNVGMIVVIWGASMLVTPRPFVPIATDNIAGSCSCPARTTSVITLHD
jgi:hypothetical protein